MDPSRPTAHHICSRQPQNRFEPNFELWAPMTLGLLYFSFIPDYPLPVWLQIPLFLLLRAYLFNSCFHLPFFLLFNKTLQNCLLLEFYGLRKSTFTIRFCIFACVQIKRHVRPSSSPYVRFVQPSN